MEINNRSRSWHRIISLSCFLFLWLLWSLPPARATLISLDDYEGNFVSLDLDITGVFRTPSVGPPFSAAWYQPTGSAKAYLVQALDGQGARVAVPQGGSLDYIENLGGPYGNKIFWITWDIVVTEINGGWGMFFIRFPTVNNSMQILFGFMDDGRVIRFSGPPAVDTLVPVGTFQAGTRYTVRFEYDLVSNCFSAFLNGVRVVNREPIPSHFNVDAIDKFGFDINQKISLPDLPPAQGNMYYVDNIRFEELESSYLPLVLTGH
jgi:hypothetical protein